jgi:hypothetical protein
LCLTRARAFLYKFAWILHFCLFLDNSADILDNLQSVLDLLLKNEIGGMLKYISYIFIYCVIYYIFPVPFVMLLFSHAPDPTPAQIICILRTVLILQLLTY